MFALWWAAPLACIHAESLEDLDDSAGLWADIDVAWASRARDGEQPVVEAIRAAADAVGPTHPELSWRKARLWLHRGLQQHEPLPAGRRFARAREEAIACLEADGAFRQRRDIRGWEDAVAVLEPSRRVCALWAAAGWTRWLTVFDSQAASLDFAIIRLLLETGRSARPELAVWTEGLLVAVAPPGQGRDPQTARTALTRVLGEQPDSWVRRLDVARWVALPQDDAALLGRLKRGSRRAAPELPEERLALRELSNL